LKNYPWRSPENPVCNADLAARPPFPTIANRRAGINARSGTCRKDQNVPRIEADAHLRARRQRTIRACLGYEIGIPTLDRHIEEFDLAEKVPGNDAARRSGADVAPGASRRTPCGRIATTTASPSRPPGIANAPIPGDGRSPFTIPAISFRWLKNGQQKGSPGDGKLFGRALLDDAPPAHQHDAVAYPHGLLRVMRKRSRQ
jgi:hypothetical protein